MAFFTFDSGDLVGCSGGVYCLLAACTCTTILNWREDRAVLVRVTSTAPPFAFCGKMLRILKLAALLAFFGLNFGSAVSGRGDRHVSMVAHSFGAVTGFLAGFTVRPAKSHDLCNRVFFIFWGNLGKFFIFPSGNCHISPLKVPQGGNSLCS